MSNVDTAVELGRIRRAAGLVRTRMRLSRVFGIAPLVVPTSLLLLAVVLAAHKVDPAWLPQASAIRISIAIIAAAVVAWGVAFALPLPPNIGPLLLDKQHALAGRLTNALEFAALPESERTPLMQAAIEESCAYVAERPRAATLKASAAAPLFAGMIVSWWAFLLMLVPAGGMLALVAAFEIRTPAPPPETQVKGPPPVELISQDDAEAFRDARKEIEKPGQTPEMKAALDRFDRLLEDLADKKLDRNQALREMEAFEREMLASSAADQKKLAEELKDTAKQLDKSDLAKDLADSLKKNDLKKAEKQLKDLANRLRNKCIPEGSGAVDGPAIASLLDVIRAKLLSPEESPHVLISLLLGIWDPPAGAAKLPSDDLDDFKKNAKPCPKKVDKEQLKKLREALKKAVERRKEALAKVNEQRAEMQEQLLKKKKQVEDEKDPKKREEEEKLLKKKERELERLDRESAAQSKANRELEKLDRELSEAAQNLMKDLGISQEDLEKAAKALEDAAEDMNRMDQEAMTEQQKEELKKKLEELRELIRQQKGDKKRQSRMVKFSKRARSGNPGKAGQGQKGDDGEDGEEGDEGEEGDQGKNGKGKKGQGQGDGEDGPEGQGKGKGKGKGKGQGDGDGDGVEITIGPGGVPIPMPGQGSGDGKEPGDGGGKGGKDAGKGSGGPIAGDRTDPKFGTNDIQQEGLETNQGGSDSQVISAAAEKGFRGGDYRKIFTDYRTHAEENINKEDIPDGYRFYVRRYFQLIRPRD